MKYTKKIYLCILILFFMYGTLEAITDPNDWYDECPDQSCGAPPAGGVGGGGAGGGPILVSYDLGPYWSLQEDADADGILDTRDNCPYLENDQVKAGFFQFCIQFFFDYLFLA